MITLYVEYLSPRYRALLARGFVHFCHHVDANNIAMMVGRL